MHPIVEFLKAIDRSADETPQALLDRVLRECRLRTGAEAGTVYLARDEAGVPVLAPMSLQNDAVALEPVSFVVPLDRGSIAGYAAVTGETLLIDDAYAIPAGRPYRFNPSFDEKTGYRTVSVACIALRRTGGDVSAVVQLINRRDANGNAIPFDREQADFIAAAGVVISGAVDRAAMLDRLAAQNRELQRQYARIEALQAETEAALVEARRSNRAKTEFLNCIGHEMRTPLNAVIGFSELLRNEGMGPLGHPSYRNFAADIAEGGHKLLRIVNDILAIVGADANQRDLRDGWRAAYGCVEDTVRAWFEPAAEANLVLAAEIAEEPGACAVDRATLQTVLERLIDNAVKFTPAGGEITVTVGPGADGALAIEVRDTGIGMTAEEVTTSLAPFGQVDSSLARRYEGPGLGLTVAASLTRSMGGTLDVDSVPDEGTTVTLRFPATAAPDSGQNADAPAAIQAAGE